MRGRHVLFFSAGLVLLGALSVSIYSFRAPLAWAAWHKLHSAPIAAALDASDPELSFEIGNYYFGGGAYDTKKAESYLRAALKLDPSLEGAHYQLARIHFIHSDFAGALQEINAELTLHPDLKRAYYVRALVYGYSGKLPEAEADFKEFLKWKPGSWAGNNDLAWIYFQEGKYADARDTARRGLAVSPNNPWLLNSLGVALLNTNDKKDAKDAFTKALAMLATMTEADWGSAYPGNDPGIYAKGYSEMKASLEANVRLLDTGDIGSSR